MGNLMVTDFKQAALQAKNGNAYIYHENNLYVPFWKIDDQSTQLNSKIYLKINTIPNNIQNFFFFFFLRSQNMTNNLI